MIMQVHDELVFELQESCIGKYSKIISSLMTDAENLSVPLVVNTFSGTNWQEHNWIHCTKLIFRYN